MKRIEHIAQLQKMNPADIRKEISELEKKLQAAKMNIAFGKSKQVRDIRNLKRALARSLTLGNQKLQASASTEGEK